MKTIIAGSRTIKDYWLVEKACALSGFKITEVVSGGAAGVDRLGEEWAKHTGVKVTQFKANWNRYGKSAGPIRNIEMAEYSSQLIAIWDGESRGTKNMIATMKKFNKLVYVLTVT